MSGNYRLVATNIGDLLKWDVSVNEIGRSANALFRFSRESFPNTSITSQRAQAIYDWILSLAKQEMDPSNRDNLLVIFCRSIAPEQHRQKIEKILKDSGIGTAMVDAVNHRVFSERGFHPEVSRHSEGLFLFSRGLFGHLKLSFVSILKAR